MWATLNAEGWRPHVSSETTTLSGTYCVYLNISSNLVITFTLSSDPWISLIPTSGSTLCYCRDSQSEPSKLGCLYIDWLTTTLCVHALWITHRSDFNHCFVDVLICLCLAPWYQLTPLITLYSYCRRSFIRFQIHDRSRRKTLTPCDGCLQRIW